MLAALGLFVFESRTFPYSEISRQQSWQHAKAERVGARAASQYTGPGDDTLSLAGALMPEAAGSYGSIDVLRRMANEGEAYPFVDGSGVVWGSFVITRLDERRKHMLVDGTPRMIDFTVDLDRVA